VQRWGATRAPYEVSRESDATGRRSFFIMLAFHNHSPGETKAINPCAKRFYAGGLPQVQITV